MAAKKSIMAASSSGTRNWMARKTRPGGIASWHQ
jgi:hypothetical protein